MLGRVWAPAGAPGIGWGYRQTSSRYRNYVLGKAPTLSRAVIRLGEVVDVGKGLGPGWRTGDRMGVIVKQAYATKTTPVRPTAIPFRGRVGPHPLPGPQFKPRCGNRGGAQEMEMVNQARA